MKVLITGGTRSGKSRFALELAERSGPKRVYIATAQPLDSEMTARILRHRSARGPGWTTIEETTNVVPLLRRREVVLVDCLTLWLSNLLLQHGAQADLSRDFEALAVAVAEAENPVILVTNEVGLGIVPENVLARRFRDLAGELSQTIARTCDRVVLMCAGIPLDLKGRPS